MKRSLRTYFYSKRGDPRGERYRQCLQSNGLIVWSHIWGKKTRNNYMSQIIVDSSVCSDEKKIGHIPERDSKVT